MKKKLLLLFAVLATAVNASAFRIVRDGITYSTQEGTTCAVIKGDDVYSGDIIISSTVTSDGGTTYTVVSIAENAFKECSDLTSVVIPETVTSIGEEAFYQSGLISVVIPESVISIGSEAFQYCTKLTSVTIPNSVSSIVSYTFKGCSNLTSVVIGNSVTSIGNYAFKECPSLASLEIGNSVSSIGESAFSFCSSLESVVIPASVTSISSDAFSCCSKLNEVISLKPTAPELGTNCFQYVSGDLKIKVPSASVEAYRAATNWSSYSSNIEAIPTSYTLSDGTDYKIVYEYSGCDITYTRSISHDNWHGFYLPFDVDVTKVSGTYATLTSVSDNTLNWTTLGSGTIAAGTPFIYKPTAAGDITFSVTDATIHSCTESHPITSNDYTLSGTYTTKSDMATDKAYALSNGNFYYTTDNGKTLKPYRIYLTVPSSKSGAPIRSRIDGLDVTGIEDVDIDVDHQQRFNLLGQTVDSDYKGIVIVNGKKVMRK